VIVLPRILRRGASSWNEQIEVVEISGQVLDVRSARVVHRMGLRHRGVVVFVCDREGRFLLQRRSAKRDVYPSVMEVPGEHCMPNETFR